MEEAVKERLLKIQEYGRRVLGLEPLVGSNQWLIVKEGLPRTVETYDEISSFRSVRGFIADGMIRKISERNAGRAVYSVTGGSWVIITETLACENGLLITAHITERTNDLEVMGALQEAKDWRHLTL